MELPPDVQVRALGLSAAAHMLGDGRGLVQDEPSREFRSLVKICERYIKSGTWELSQQDFVDQYTDNRIIGCDGPTCKCEPNR